MRWGEVSWNGRVELMDVRMLGCAIATAISIAVTTV